MAASIIVIEIPRQLPLAFILTRGSQGARAVWASRQGGNLRISRPKPAPTLTEIDPRLSHPSETPERVEQVVRLHLHRRPSGPVGEGEDPCPDTQDIAVGACVSADQAWSDPARMGQLLQTRRGEIHLQQIGHLHLVEACPHAAGPPRLELWAAQPPSHHPRGRRLLAADGVKYFGSRP
jgi:hypothetical protein